MNPEIKIEPEFENLLIKLKPDEYDRLEQSVRAEGCRDPLVIWAGEGDLVDGHNRLAICKKHGLPFQIIKKEFDDDNAVKQWIISNQLSRRNLSSDERLLLIGMEAKLREKVQGQRSDLTSAQNEPKLKPLAAIAEKHNVSIATVKRAEQLVDAVAELKEVAPELRQQLSDGDAPAKSNIVKAAKVAKTDPVAAKKILTEKPQSKEVIQRHEPALARQYATMAISQLTRILPKDPDKQKAFGRVFQWMQLEGFRPAKELCSKCPGNLTVESKMKIIDVEEVIK